MGLCSAARRNFLHIYSATSLHRFSRTSFSFPQSFSLVTSGTSVPTSDVFKLSAYSSDAVRGEPSSRRRIIATIFIRLDASASTWSSTLGTTTSTPLTCDRVAEHGSSADAPSRSTNTSAQLAAHGEGKSLVAGANGARFGMTAICEMPTAQQTSVNQ